MLTGRECRQTVVDAAAAVVAEVELEIVVQHIGACHLSVDCQFQVMTYAAVGDVDAVLIVEFGMEHGRGVHRTAVDEGAAVQVAIDAGTYAVVSRLASGLHGETRGVAMGRAAFVGADGIEGDESGAIAIADILRQHETQGELPVPDTVAAGVQDVGTVGIGEGRRSLSLIVQTAGNLLLYVAHGDGHHPTESRGSLDMTSHRHGLPYRQGCARGSSMTVDAVDHHLQGRHGQPQGRVAQQRELQFVGRLVHTYIITLRRGRHQQVLGQTASLADGAAVTALIVAQHIAGVGTVHVAVVVGIDGACGAIEGHSTALRVEQGGLADVLLQTVEGHDVARGRQPQRQPSGGRCAEVVQVDHLLMRQRVRCSVTAVVHHQRSALHLLLYEFGHLRVTVARR